MQTLFESLESFLRFGSWTWQAPALAAALAVLAILGILRPRGARQTLAHPDGAWLYRAPGFIRRTAHAAMRYIMLAFAAIAFMALALYFGQPSEVRVERRYEHGLAAASFVVDVSGSMSCDAYLPAFRVFDGFFAAKAEFERTRETSVLAGLYYFSTSPLLELFPTADAKLLKIATVYGPGCGSSAQGYGGGQVGPRIRDMKQIYDAASSTEPGSSVWQAVLDFVLYERPEYAARVSALKDRGALVADAPPLKTFWDDAAVQDDICQAMRGKRIAVVTDTDFGLASGVIPFAKAAESAAFFCVPVDLIATENYPAKLEEILPAIRLADGTAYLPGRRSEDIARSILEAVTRNAPPERVETEIVRDTRPATALLVVAFLAFGVAALLRCFVLFVDW